MLCTAAASPRKVPCNRKVLMCKEAMPLLVSLLYHARLCVHIHSVQQSTLPVEHYHGMHLNTNSRCLHVVQQLLCHERLCAHNHSVQPCVALSWYAFDQQHIQTSRKAPFEDKKMSASSRESVPVYRLIGASVQTEFDPESLSRGCRPSDPVLRPAMNVFSQSTCSLQVHVTA